MSTGTIQDPSVLVIQNRRIEALQPSFTNDSGSDLTQGQEVTLKADGTVDVRDAGTEKPLGVVIVGAVDGERVTVRTFFTLEMNVVATGGNIDAGTYVVPNGSKDSEGRPQYVAASLDDYTCALVINGALQDAVMKIGILDGIVKVEGL